ncbi:glycosyltransferase [Demequina sp. TTPB684]|uniref:glycosyltransferase n=1 Tax=unclassified Demequina TaxID=2620311 RepID=UPI001CF438DD|nr:MULTISPECIES: glycosyltransferase [unclassified Demequina]MCB2412737.1 glycosyltransferase [Demequina sp. TTPB684]UPU88885.1 glycosyltransferase [Demequina sp. TMPB413]
MKIAHIANFYGPTSGGLRTAMHALGAGYLERGHEMLLVVPGPADADEQTPYGRRITVRAPIVPFSGGYRVITRTREVRGILTGFAPDVLEVSDRTTLRALGGWASSHGIPSAFFAHERADGILHANLPSWLDERLPVEGMADWHNRGTHRLFTTVVCTTEYARAEFTRAGLHSVKVPLGVDLERYHPRNASTEVHDRFAAGAESLVLMASRLSTEKRPELAIEAIRILEARGRSVRLVSAGTGNIAAKMQELAQGLPVTFLGFVTDRELFAGLLASADVVVAPGPIETFGLAALEALASGTPAVVNAASALPEVVDDAGVAADGTAEAFADAIETVLARDADARRAAARARAETMPWSATIDKMLALHEAALAAVEKERDHRRQ